MASESESPPAQTINILGVWVDVVTSIQQDVDSKELETEEGLNQIMTKLTDDMVEQINQFFHSPDSNVIDARKMTVEHYPEDVESLTSAPSPKSLIVLVKPDLGTGLTKTWGYVNYTQKRSAAFDHADQKHKEDIDAIHKLYLEMKKDFAKEKEGLEKLTGELTKVNEELKKVTKQWNRQKEMNGKVTKELNVQKEVNGKVTKELNVQKEVNGKVTKELEDQKEKLESLTELLAIEKKERKAETDLLLGISMPIHLRALLDKSRKNICDLLGKTLDQLMTDPIEPGLIFGALEARKLQGPEQGLPKPSQQSSQIKPENFPSRDAIEFLMKKPNRIRDAGNEAAHEATDEQIHTAVKNSAQWYHTPEHDHMKVLFKFCCGQAFDSFVPHTRS